MKALLVAAATASLLVTGCMDHYRRVETTHVSSGIRPGRPLASSIKPYILLRDRNPGLIAEARASLSCSATRVEISRRDEIIDIQAGSSRWIAGILLLGAAGVVALESNGEKEDQGLLYTLLGGGTAVIVAPTLAERQKHRFLGYDVKDSPVPAYRCEDHGLGEVRVTLRDESGTHERTTDARGRADFPQANAWTVRLAYIDDQPVPAVLVGSEADPDAE